MSLKKAERVALLRSLKAARDSGKLTELEFIVRALRIVRKKVDRRVLIERISKLRLEGKVSEYFWRVLVGEFRPSLLKKKKKSKLGLKMPKMKIASSLIANSTYKWVRTVPGD